MVYIYYHKEEYLERHLKFIVEILQNHFYYFYFEKLHSLEKDTLKHWDLQWTKPIILPYSL